MSVSNSSYKTLKFGHDLTIILDSTIQIDYPKLKQSLDEVQKGTLKSIELNEALVFDMQGKNIIFMGYKVADGWFISSHAYTPYVLPFDKDRHKILDVLYYLYHMAVTI